MSYWYDLHQRTMFGTKVIAENILPTPFLMDAAYNKREGVEAYEETPATDGHPAVWRARDDNYDRRYPGVVYTRIHHVTKHEPPPVRHDDDDWDPTKVSDWG
jgi:hypothetical protein